MATPLPLEGDGVVENLFHYLWTTDDLGNGPRVSVPPTVICRGSQPVAWYFTSRKSGRIKRKHRANLTAAHIEHAFTKRKAPTDIVAYYLYLPNQSSTNPAIEYYDAEALREFLFKRPEIPHSSPGSVQAAGILQQFSLPKGSRNSMLRAIWSPKLCLLERRINIHAIHDARFSVYERGVTFEEGGGAEALSRAEPVRGSILPGMVQQLCERVVDHVTRVSYHKFRIARMVLRLQVDTEDRLWLLWSSSLRLQPPLTTVMATIGPDGTPVEAGIRPLDIVRDAKVPNFAFAQGAGGGPVSLSSTSNSINDADEEPRTGQARCASCARVVAHRSLLPTTYKAVLAHFQHVLRFLRESLNEENQAAIQWPPDERVVEQAGGVGFGILKHLKAVNFSNEDRGGLKFGLSVGMKTWQGRDLLMPPVIMYLHPTLRAEDFARHRQDPIFLHKSVEVCERCCLVYADYATASLEANGIGIRSSASAPALLRPTREQPKLACRLDGDPSHSLLLSTTNIYSPSTKGTRGTVSKTKPPASAWQPVPTEERQRKRLGKYNPGPRSTLDSLPIAPILPPRIETFEPDDNNALRIPDGLRHDGSPQHQQQEREEAFFRELYQQKNTVKRGGHALKHILDAADRLSKAKPQHRLAALGESTQIGQSHSTGALVDAIAELKLARKPGKSPYSVVQRIRDGRGSPVKNQGPNSTSPSKVLGKQESKFKPQKQPKEAKKAQDKGDCEKPRFMSSREKQAAAAHRDFLVAALSDAQVQLEHIESLATLVTTSNELERETKVDQNLQEEEVNAKKRPPSPQEEEPLEHDIEKNVEGGQEDQEYRIELEEIHPVYEEGQYKDIQQEQEYQEVVSACGVWQAEDPQVMKDIASSVEDNDHDLGRHDEDEELPFTHEGLCGDQDQELHLQNEELGNDQDQIGCQHQTQRQLLDEDEDYSSAPDQEQEQEQAREQVEDQNQELTQEQEQEQEQHQEQDPDCKKTQDQYEIQAHSQDHLNYGSDQNFTHSDENRGEQNQDAEQVQGNEDQDEYEDQYEDQAQLEQQHAADHIEKEGDFTPPGNSRPMQDLLAQAHELLASAVSSDSVDVDGTSEEHQTMQEHNISSDAGDSNDLSAMPPVFAELDDDSGGGRHNYNC